MLIFPLLLIAHSARALPTRRDNGILIQDAMASMYNMYLESQSVTNVAFYPLLGGEREIDFAGVGVASDSDNLDTNNIVYETADSLPHMPRFNSSGDLQFSMEYMNFIQALLDITNSANSTQVAQLNNLSMTEQVACTTNLTTVTDSAYTAFKDAGGVGEKTDDAFLQFAEQDYGSYTLAVQACQDAQDAYQKAVSARSCSSCVII